MKIAFLGTGAIGASLVRALYLNKVPFTILVRDKKRKADLLRNGIRYRLKSFTHVELGMGQVARMRQGRQRHGGQAADGEVLTVAESKKYDYIFLGMKTPNLPASAKTAKAHLTKSGKIILLQNGLPEGAVKGFKEAQIISGIVGYNVQLMPDGSYFQSNPGHLILGTAGELPIELKAALEPHQPVVLTHNSVGFRWNKLAINSVINGLGAVTGLALGPLFSRLDARRTAIQLIKEAAEVMIALKIEEGIVPGAISVYKMAAIPAFLQHAIIFFLGRKYAKIRTSMLQDIERGVKTEVDEIHGAIVSAAKKAGMSVPVTAAIMERVHLLEQGKLKPEASALVALLHKVNK